MFFCVPRGTISMDGLIIMKIIDSVMKWIGFEKCETCGRYVKKYLVPYYRDSETIKAVYSCLYEDCVNESVLRLNDELEEYLNFTPHGKKST